MISRLCFVSSLPCPYLEGFLCGWLVDGGGKSPQGTSGMLTSEK